jgi:hypothetical protein
MIDPNGSETNAEIVNYTFASKLQWNVLFGIDKDFQFSRKNYSYDS